MAPGYSAWLARMMSLQTQWRALEAMPHADQPETYRRLVFCAFTLPTQTAVTTFVVPPTTQVDFASFVVPVFAKPHALPVAPRSAAAVPPVSTPCRASPVATAIDEGMLWWQSALGTSTSEPSDATILSMATAE